MSDKVPVAVRRTDYTAEDYSQILGLLGDLIKDLVPVASWTVKVVSLGGGPVGFIVGLALSTALEMAFDAAVDYAVDGLTEYTVKDGQKEILEGSPNVFFNKLEAARGGPKGDPTLTRGLIMQGSQWVDINTRPAARQGDKTRLSGRVVFKKEDHANIFIGGDPTSFDNTLPLPADLEKAIQLLKIANELRKLPKDVKEFMRDAKKAYRDVLSDRNTSTMRRWNSLKRANQALSKGESLADSVWKSGNGLGNVFGGGQ
jgi:uncharacterized Zn-binding protein involved in type VI secretion